MISCSSMQLQTTGFQSFSAWMIFHCVYVYHTFFIHLSTDEHLGWSHILDIVNSVAVKDFIFYYVSHSRIAGSYGSSTFRLFRNLHAVLDNGSITLHSHQECVRVSLSLHPLQHLLSWLFFDDSYFTWDEMIPYCGFDLHFLDD
jgi:hypothetical protein